MTNKNDIFIPDEDKYLSWIADWAQFSEQWWYDHPADDNLGCYGTGYNHWGVQTNQKYLAAMALLAAHPRTPGCIDREWALDRALKAFRFSLASHLTGSASCTDDSSWGHTWISALGIERMMFGVNLLQPHLSDSDRSDLQRLLASEADWIRQDHHRDGHKGVFGDRWAESGKNVPESNLWNGALLWRTAVMYPDHKNSPLWRDAAHRFLINSVSIEKDSDDHTPVAGRAVKDWFEGANFFDHFALDHHGYLNTGYMVICTSNAAMLHFDLKSLKLKRPQSLDHHQKELWDTIRIMLFSNGRIARIGGDSRVRYCYCQDYLLPSLLYAADRFNDTHAGTVLENALEMIQTEFERNGDGGFYSRRLDHIAKESPYYYTRLESDRACALAQMITYSKLLDQPLFCRGHKDFEKSAESCWCEPEHGSVMHRCETRLASMSWRAHSRTQAICQPPWDGHLTDWAQNLTGCFVFAGQHANTAADNHAHRRVTHRKILRFAGGFLTIGRVLEGCGISLAEGWHSSEGLIEHWIAVAALPDGHTLAALQYARTLRKRVILKEIKGLHLNLINDFYNSCRRKLVTRSGAITLEKTDAGNEVIPLNSSWANVDEKLGIAGIYGAPSLQLHRSGEARAGSSKMLCSLNVDEINWHCEVGTRFLDADRPVLDVGWAVFSDCNAESTARQASQCHPAGPAGSEPDSSGLRMSSVCGADGHDYILSANFGQYEARLEKDHAAERIAGTKENVLAPGHAKLSRIR